MQDIHAASTDPLCEVPQIAGEDVKKWYEVRVERHVQHARVLFIQRRDDRLRDVNGREAREEELVEEVRGVAHG